MWPGGPSPFSPGHWHGHTPVRLLEALGAGRALDLEVETASKLCWFIMEQGTFNMNQSLKTF